MLASTERAPNRPSPLPLPSALLAAELGPVVMADHPCEAAFSAADPTGPRKYYRARYYDPKIGRFISEDPTPVPDRRLRELNAYAYVANDPVNWVDPLGTDMRKASDEMNRAWPFDPAAPFKEAFQRFPNGPGGTTRDRQRHCYVSCIQLRRNGPLFAWWGPADFAREFGGAFVGQRSFREALGDFGADAYGAAKYLDFSKTCEEICSTCPLNRPE